MPQSSIIHVVARASVERAEQARACYLLGYHAEIYSNYEELLAAAPGRGMALAEDMTDRGGVEALIRMLANAGIWMPVIAMGHNPEPGRVVEAIHAGALDYLALGFSGERLFAALRRAAIEAERLGRAQRLAVEAHVRLQRLTHREREVLDLLVEGYSNKMIARKLEISPRTVEIHRAHMMSKLGASHVADAVRLALEATIAGSPVRAETLKVQLAA